MSSTKLAKPVALLDLWVTEVPWGRLKCGLTDLVVADYPIMWILDRTLGIELKLAHVPNVTCPS